MVAFLWMVWHIYAGYRQVSNISRTSVGDGMADHSDVVQWIGLRKLQDDETETHSSFGIWCAYIKDFTVFVFLITDGSCGTGRFGRDYMGVSTGTSSGYTCQRWDSFTPHYHDWQRAYMYPDDTIAEAGNYCRNPSGRIWPWCYTTIETVKWEFCPIYELSCGKYKPNFTVMRKSFSFVIVNTIGKL